MDVRPSAWLRDLCNRRPRRRRSSSQDLLASPSCTPNASAAVDEGIDWNGKGKGKREDRDEFDAVGETEVKPGDTVEAIRARPTIITFNSPRVKTVAERG